ncbi:MAG: RluA family pseudouridine synthase [Dehalococcoidales bacterium]|nr:RluA family pseudouridine synthase [Dehalococcoidales bacterium]
MDNAYSFISDRTGCRLDKYISEKYTDLSRTKVQKLIVDGSITVNDDVVKASFKLNIGDRVNVFIPPPAPSILSPEAIALHILYEDTDLLVINKPAGLTVHPAPGHPNHTLVNAILSHVPSLVEISDSVRPGIVHRLDKDTSGVMLVAKTNKARLNLISQFERHSVIKVYLVLVKGHLVPESGMIEAPIGRDPSNRKRMTVVAEGRDARTRYDVVKYLGNFTLLEIRTETGRTHQIRVHLAAIGFPVVGDTTYGVKVPFLSRQFLHACRLGCALPSTGEYMEFTAELPPDLAQALEAIS